jgi:lipoate-protein ligase A
MKLLDITLPDSASELAVEEALLDEAEGQSQGRPEFPELFRLWEPAQTIAVCGRSSPLKTEINLEFCQRESVEVFRRCSGGQSIIAGPGCLMYAVLLDYRKRPELRPLDKAHQFVMRQMQSAIERTGITVQQQGTSDLTFQNRKFSGNSLRCKKNWLLYHGTILCDFDLSMISKCLGTPVRQPDYRRGRSHADFLIQLPIEIATLRTALTRQWQTHETLTDWPRERTESLKEKYLSAAWTGKVP